VRALGSLRVAEPLRHSASDQNHLRAIMATQSKDIVIIGGGVVGSATAYWLAQAPGLDGRRVTVVEKDPTYAVSSTPRSAGGVRQQFSTPENIALSKLTLDILRDLKPYFGPEASLPFREQGYLILAPEEGANILASNVEIQRANGGDIVLLDPKELAARFSWLNTEGVACGSFGQSGEGWVDPVLLHALFRNAARDKGVTFLKDEVTGIEVNGPAVTSVSLASGTRIPCGAVVNAAGFAAGAVSKLAGIELPVEPRKRYIFVIDRRDSPEELHKAPLTVDTSGVFFRPEGRMFITGISPEEENEPPAVDLDAINYEEFEEIVWPNLATRVPLFETAKVVNAWAGYYDYNTLDQNAIIGAHPQLTNFYFANGFSGHGLQQAAAAGRAVTELIMTGRFQTIDLTRFGYERIAAGQPLLETNII
jgi:sarcosine oxidase